MLEDGIVCDSTVSLFCILEAHLIAQQNCVLCPLQMKTAGDCFIRPAFFGDSGGLIAGVDLLESDVSGKLDATSSFRQQICFIYITTTDNIQQKSVKVSKYSR